jgi:hypothetical protein
LQPPAHQGKTTTHSSRYLTIAMVGSRVCPAHNLGIFGP